MCFQKELREEDKRYRDYLEELKLIEAQREIEMEKLVDMEVEKMWQKRLAQWKLEKQARQNLLQEVLAGRQQQVQKKCKLTLFLLGIQYSVSEELNLTHTLLSTQCKGNISLRFS